MKTRTFDHDEDDGQLSLFEFVDFGYDEIDGMNGISDINEIDEINEGDEMGEMASDEGALPKGKVKSESPEVGEPPLKKSKSQGVLPTDRTVKQRSTSSAGSPEFAQAAASNIRIQHCSSCGKLLFVQEDTSSYRSHCNSCGITYLQKR